MIEVKETHSKVKRCKFFKIDNKLFSNMIYNLL
jgi:hypothetical protein